jgi:putative ATP-dependent endonuclease of the OLD family
VYTREKEALMKLATVTLKNFRGYCDETPIDIGNLTAFIGRNDAGKSTILEALEIFFNNTVVTCEREDLSIDAEGRDIEIGCVFSDVPNQIVIDAANPTNLADEHLLNGDGKLEIKKVFPATAAKPNEKVYICCMHPSVDGCADLLQLKRTELRARADQLRIDAESYNGNVNASIRQAIREHIAELDLRRTQLLVDKEDTKKVYDTIKGYLPVYALFQSDRPSRDDDREVADPMKLAVKQALTDLGPELEHIRAEVRAKAVDTANRTLVKLREMAPELARELTPEFRAEPKFDSQFKLSIKSEDDIPVNKRGSGVRRLIVLNFFRSEAERRRSETVASEVIYAFEEPETSQHPDHQEMLIKAFLELSSSPTAQIILTTHTPALAGFLPLESLRFIERDGHRRTVESGTDEVFQKVAEALGVLPDPIPRNATAILLVEGKGDVTFVRHAAEMLRDGGFLPATFEERRFAIVPIGGCGNVKHWLTLQVVQQFGVPYCVLLDSDRGTSEEAANGQRIADLRGSGVKANLTRRREPENYIHLDCLDIEPGSAFTFNETDDAKQLISAEKGTRKSTILEDYWVLMSCEQIREVERYFENGVERFEFTEMFDDFLSLTDPNT